jgi:hypothetical protein
MTGAEAIYALKEKFGVSTDSQLAALLGITPSSVQTWKNRQEVTARQFADLVYSASKKGALRFETVIIRPLVEFFPVEVCASRQGTKKEIFGTRNSSGEENRHRSGLRQELEQKHGIYIFFDSQGKAIYVGKAGRNLWKEMNMAFNRDRGWLQRIKRINHPDPGREYQTSEEKARQIRPFIIPLHEIALYFSAYEVADPLIDDMEALLVRSFANDLLNQRMEKFAIHRRGTQ